MMLLWLVMLRRFWSDSTWEKMSIRNITQGKSNCHCQCQFHITFFTFSDTPLPFMMLFAVEDRKLSRFFLKEEQMWMNWITKTSHLSNLLLGLKRTEIFSRIHLSFLGMVKMILLKCWLLRVLRSQLRFQRRFLLLVMLILHGSGEFPEESKLLEDQLRNIVSITTECDHINETHLNDYIN